MQWVALFIYLGTILICSALGSLWLIAIIPFLFFSLVGLGIFCFDIIKPNSRGKLKWDGILWLLILFVASSSCFLNFIELVKGIP